MYLTVKHLHVAFVTLSVGGFFVRGLLMMADSPLLRRRWVKMLPHINDTLLLAAALTLMVMTQQYPFVHAWLTAKVLGLLAYILLGALALRPGRPRGVRVAAWLAALAVFAYVVTVALTKNPLGVFSVVGG